jgi:hypothetical protein
VAGGVAAEYDFWRGGNYINRARALKFFQKRE